MSFGRASQDDLAGMAGHLSADTAAPLGRRREIAGRRRAALRELEAAEQRLRDKQRRAGSPGGRVHSRCPRPRGVRGDGRPRSTLSYHVPGASWRPLYDLTLDGEQLAVSYLAEVSQQTGEDWPAVELVLSTTRRGLYQALPELDPWYIGRPRRRCPAAGRRAMARHGRSAPEGRRDPAPSRRGSQWPSPRRRRDAPAGGPASGRRAGRGEAGAGLTYQVQRPLAVPADGGPHKTAVARLRARRQPRLPRGPGSRPRGVPAGHRHQRLALLLLPGPARVFHGTEFVGETPPGHRRRGRGVRAAARGGRPDQGGAQAPPAQPRARP